VFAPDPCVPAGMLIRRDGAVSVYRR